MIVARAFSPSLKAAGPGCSISADLISCSSWLRTAGSACQPGRAATFSGRNFLPHQEPIITSGWRRMTSSGSVRIRFLPRDCSASSGKISSPPAMPISSDTQRIALISGSPPSSKNTLGLLFNSLLLMDINSIFFCKLLTR